MDYKKIIILILLIIIPLVLFFGFDFKGWVFLPYLTLPIAFKLIKMLYSYNGKELNKTLELTARLSAIFGILFSAGILL